MILVALAVFASILVAPGWASSRAGGEIGEGWSRVDAARLEVLSDAGPETTRDVALRLESFLESFARLAPALETEPPAPTVVVAFRDPSVFAQYRAGQAPAGARILGQFLPGSDGSFLTLTTDDDGVPAVEVLQHELVHHLVETNFPGAPRWLHEGLAEVYGTFELDLGDGDDGASRATIGSAPERHLRYLETEDWSVADVLSVGRGAHDGAGVGFYSVSWLLVHRLLAHPERMAGLADLLLGLGAEREPIGELEDALGMSVRELDEDLRTDFAAGRAVGRLVELGPGLGRVGEPEALAPARALWILSRLSVRVGREGRAERELQQALDHDPRSPEAHAGLAWLRELGGRLDEASILYEDAHELGPSEPWVWLVRGRFLARYRSDEIAAARADLGRVVVMAPGWIEARRVLALSHLAKGGSFEEGLRILAPARAAAPARVDLTEVELRLRLAREEWLLARRLLQDELIDRIDPNAQGQLADLIDQRELLAQARDAEKDGDLDAAIRYLDEAIEVTGDPGESERLEGVLRELQEARGL